MTLQGGPWSPVLCVAHRERERELLLCRPLLLPAILSLISATPAAGQGSVWPVKSVEFSSENGSHNDMPLPPDCLVFFTVSSVTLPYLLLLFIMDNTELFPSMPLQLRIHPVHN